MQSTQSTQSAPPTPLATSIHEPARETPVAGTYDVVVAGGGLAGCVAAIAAARNGASTLLVERLGILGGTTTAALMTSFNGFRNEHEPNALQTVKGLGQEIVDELLRIGGATPLTSHGDYSKELRIGNASYAVGYDPDALQFVLIKLLKGAGVKILLHTFVAGVSMHGHAIRGLFVENKSGRQAVLGAVVVDATGDGDVAAAAGAPFAQARKGADERMMRTSLMLRVANVHRERFESQRSCIVIGNTAVVWGPSGGEVDGTNADDLSAGEIAAREQVPAFMATLRERPGFEECVLVGTAAQLGIRETRRIVGEYTVTEQDAIGDTRFPDVIAISSNPVPGYYGKRYFFEHEGFDVPYRSLVPLRVEQLLVTGRCISCEQVPFQSARSQAPLMAISQAAGTAAALCARQSVSPRRLDYRQLQATLLGQGAELRLPAASRQPATAGA